MVIAAMSSSVRRDGAQNERPVRGAYPKTVEDEKPFKIESSKQSASASSCRFGQNDAGTSAKSDTPPTQARSADVHAALGLHIGRRKTGVTVCPDLEWPGMWRLHQGDRVSDMVNLARAKDAAITWALAGRNGGLGSEEVVHWKRRESPAEAPLSAFSPAGAG